MSGGGASAIRSFADVLERAGKIPMISAAQKDKKNFAERFSKHTATYIANGLRPEFRGILPNEDGTGQESPAPTERGFKRLDVNFSTPTLGLALGVSVKSIHNPDPKNGRFTKNYSRNDNELRAEAVDYHRRQPFAVLVGVLYLPVASCEDASETSEEQASSFGSAVKYFRRRAGRERPSDEPDLFELFYIATYDLASSSDRYFDVMTAPPRTRRPTERETLDFSGFIERIRRAYEARNRLGFDWAE